MLSKDVKNSNDAYGHELIVRHFGTTVGNFRLYEDDGKSFDYETGESRVREISIDERGRLSETIVNGKGPAMFGPIVAVEQLP